MSDERSERDVVRVVAAAQFINVLEFVIVMPLGPDFAAQLAIPANQLSYVAASYTAAAALAGVAGAFFLDRFDRRSAITVTLTGLVLCTAAAGLSTTFVGLLCARALAGLFGGPATSLAMSIVADAVPAPRRGRAMSVVLSAFALASIFGVPAGLALARYAGWRAPLLAIAALGLVAVALTRRLPRMVSHIAAAREERPGLILARLFGDPTVRLSYTTTFVLQCSGFLLIPSYSPYLQHNLGVPRGYLELLYLGGGVGSVIALRIAGRLVDRHGSLPVAAVAVAALAGIVGVIFLGTPSLAWVPVLFVSYMVALGARNVAYNTLASKVPSAADRARFQSMQSAVTHVAISLGSGLAGRLLSTGPRGELVGMPRVAVLAIGLSTLVPLLMARVEQRVRAAELSA